MESGSRIPLKTCVDESSGCKTAESEAHTVLEKSDLGFLPQLETYS